MDLSGYSFMDQDQDVAFMGDGAPVDYDYVKWQGSQTANQALNQLIRSSVNEPVLAKAKENVDVNIGSSRGWQREPSFDQIPGFSSLSTVDRDNGSGGGTSSSSSVFRTPQSASTSSSKALSSSRPSLSRPRPSETKSRPSSALGGSSNAELSSPMTIPFFDKTNPSQFLDILKGVSARVDANAGVRPRTSTGGIDSLPSSRVVKSKKRPRGVSLGSSSETLAARVKKGRVEALRESGGVNAKAKDKDKGKGRVRHEIEGGGELFLDGASRITGDRAGNSLPEKGDTNCMDMDDGNGDNLSDQSRNNHDSSGNSSQAKMPPPPPPAPRVKHPTAVPSHILPDTTISISTSTSTSTSRPTSMSHSNHSRYEPTTKDAKPQNTVQTPKYHPLLLQPPAKPAVPSSNNHQQYPQSKAPSPHIQPTIVHPKPNPNLYPKVKSEYRQGAPAPKPQPQTKPSVSVAAPSPSPAPAAPPTSTPQFSSSQSSRPPALGMRRTHTFPFSSSSSGMVPSLQKNGVLPTKQKGFKPPLLSASQPQAPPSLSQVPQAPAPTPAPAHVAVAPLAVKEQSSVVRVQSKQYYGGTRAPAPAGSNGSASTAPNSPHGGGGGPPSSSLSRSASTSTSNSPASSIPSNICGSRDSSVQSGGKLNTTKCNPVGGAARNTRVAVNAVPPHPPAPRVAPPQPQPVLRHDLRVPVSVRALPPATKARPPPPAARPASPPLPEPADDDPDSSFGDMSFDMDALEETMRQYD